jgi:competence protein ComEC
MPVGVLLIGFEKPGDAVWDDLQRTASAQSVPIQHVRRSQVWHIGQARLEFLHPGWKPAQADNDNSVAFRLEYGRQRTLFLGDAAAEVESQLRPGSLEVLKVAHHGSRFSTSETLLERSRPGAAIISSGVRNTYGHPARDVLNRLSRFGVRVYRTDRDGAIRYNLTTGAITVAAPNLQTGQPGAPGGRSTSRLISGR